MKRGCCFLICAALAPQIVCQISAQNQGGATPAAPQPAQPPLRPGIPPGGQPAQPVRPATPPRGQVVPPISPATPPGTPARPPGAPAIPPRAGLPRAGVVTNLPPGGVIGTNLPPGGLIGTNLPGGGIIGTSLPPGRPFDTTLPPGRPFGTNLPPGRLFSTNLPPLRVPGAGLPPGFVGGPTNLINSPLTPAQRQNINQLTIDLGRLRSRPLTPEMRLQLQRDLMAASQDRRASDPAVARLVNDLAIVAGGLSLSSFDQLRLARNLNLLMNAPALRQAQIDFLLRDTHDVLVAGGVQAPDVQTLLNDLNLITGELRPAVAPPATTNEATLAPPGTTTTPGTSANNATPPQE